MTTKVRNMTAAVLLVAGLGLTGCGSEEKTVSVNGDKVTVDQDGDGVKIETEDGSATYGSESLPDDFPEGEVPIIDAKVVGGAKNTSGGETSWSVIMQTDGDVDDVLDEVTEKLEGAGYTSVSSGNYGGSAAAQFDGDYRVGVSIAEGDGQVVVTYVVMPVEE